MPTLPLLFNILLKVLSTVIIQKKEEEEERKKERKGIQTGRGN